MSRTAPPREQLSGRLGFILLSAGCAIGMGNVWRFPFMAGEYGGAVFVLLYLFFLIFLGLPVLVMELAIGRAARASMGAAFRRLEPAGTRWHLFGVVNLAGCYLLMMFYTTVAGWMTAYCWYSAGGGLSGLDPAGVKAFFGGVLADPLGQAGWMGLTVLLAAAVCGRGLRGGVEKTVKIMMAGLFVILFILVARAVTLPGAGEGLRFYLLPDLDRATGKGLWNVANAAMAQAFFTLSVGIGNMTTFGSYADRRRSLVGEAANIVALDTLVAILAGLIIFPACFAFGVAADSGPGLVFVTLPNIFNSMSGSRAWGTLFFVFMSCAALTTVIAVFENFVSYAMDVWGWTRRKAVWGNGVALFLLSLPCVFGFNLWAGFQPFGEGSMVLDLEDFILSSNLLPLGTVVIVTFCCSRQGWGWDRFLAEADAGEGPRFPAWLRPYMQYALPVFVLVVFIQGYVDRFW